MDFIKIPNLNYQKYAQIFGGIFVGGIVFCYILFPNILKMAIKQQIKLKPGSKTRELLYLPIPFDIEFNITLWNVTNPDAVQAGEAPIMKEVGPYVFIERKLKYNVEDDEATDTMIFDQKNIFYFQPTLSLPLTGREIITIPNMIIMAGLIITNRDNAPLLPMAIKGLNEIFDDPETPFIRAAAWDILFNGVPINCDHEGFQAQAICAALEDQLGETAVFNETHLALSLFKSQNDTSTGRYNVTRGLKNIGDVGKMVEFNEEPELDVYDGDECNEIRGTDGLYFPPFLTKKDKIWAFSAALCRSIPTHYIKRSSYKGLALSRFSVTFGKNDPDCFCRDPDECLPEGVVDLSLCLTAPLVLSKPHFHDADPITRSGLIGMQPNPELHEIIADFELFVGAPASAVQRAQFSLDMEPVEDYPLTKNLPKTFLPIFWVSEGINVNKTFTNQFKMLHVAKHFNSFLKFMCITFGLIGTAACTYLSMNAPRHTTLVEDVGTVEKSKDESKMYSGSNTGKKIKQFATVKEVGASVKEAGKEIRSKVLPSLSSVDE